MSARDQLARKGPTSLLGKFFQGTLPRTTWQDWLTHLWRSTPWLVDNRQPIPWGRPR